MATNAIDIIERYNKLAIQEKELYISLIEQANEECKEVMKDDLGSQFIHSCARDLAGEVVRQFFDTSDFYITVDQLADRMIHFSYDNDIDPLFKDVKKMVYNYSEKESETLNAIISNIGSNQEKLFKKEENSKGNKEYVDKGIIQSGKNKYCSSQMDADGNINDSYTGDVGDYTEDKNGVKRSQLDVEHTQAAATATYNKRYIKQEGILELKQMLNSKDNFTMMYKTANQSKGDVRVYDKNGNDITYRATPEQLADAVCERWENIKNESKQKLIDKGYLNEDGKVDKIVKKKLTENIRHSQNIESKVILKNTEYKKVAKDAGALTTNNFGKILAGQVIYYVVPPFLFEVRSIIKEAKEKNISIDNVLEKIEKSGKRIGKYVYARLKDIVLNLAVNSIKSFVKTFMDILINLVKATVKKMLNMAKSICLAVVDSVRIIADNNRSAAEKGDAIFSLLSVSVTNIVIEVLFEYIEAQTGVPEFLLTPLQIITSVVCSNLVIIVLQKLDLFDVRLGFKINKIQEIFDKSRTQFVEQSNYLLENTDIESKLILQDITNETKSIFSHLCEVCVYDYSVREELQTLSDIFGMDVNFETSWNNYLGL